jgi:hypothetical protein
MGFDSNGTENDDLPKMAIFNDKFYNGYILLNISEIFYCSIGHNRLSVLRFPFRELRPI